MTNLYGILPPEKLPEKLIEIYNDQNVERISSDEVYEILDNLPDEVAKAFVYSHRGNFVHDAVVEFDEFDSLMMSKGNKPYYIPKKEELLKYTDDFYYEITEEYTALLDYVRKNLINDQEKAQELVEEIHGSCQIGGSIKNVMDNFSRFNVNFRSMEQINEVLMLVSGLSNNIRIWENNGHTPNEIYEMLEKPNMKPLPNVPFDFNTTNVIDIKPERRWAGMIHVHVGVVRNSRSAVLGRTRHLTNFKACLIQLIKRCMIHHWHKV